MCLQESKKASAASEAEAAGELPPAPVVVPAVVVSPDVVVIPAASMEAAAERQAEANGSAEVRGPTGARAFKRVNDEEWLGKKGAWDNSYEAKFGSSGWGAKASQTLLQVYDATSLAFSAVDSMQMTVEMPTLAHTNDHS